MNVLRSLARSAPRSFARVPARAARPQLSLCHPAAASRGTWAQPVAARTALFHSSVVRKQEFDSQELLSKLQHEISMEEEAKVDHELSANIQDFLENSSFEVEDKPGFHEVVLHRKHNDEDIRITFSVSDLNENSLAQEAMENAEEAYADDDLAVADAQSGGANTKGSIVKGKTRDGNIKVAPEDSAAMEEAEEEDDMSQSFPVHTSIVIQRRGKGSLRIEATAEDGEFVINDLTHLVKGEPVEPQTAEGEWQKRSLYSGPSFGNLDQDLQDLLDKYLQERGIDTRLALFIPDYVDHKEQREYIAWLKGIKSFVE